jgi:capsular polysaccharide biosynthesis protein
MFLSELPRVLLRRWYLVLVGLIVTVGAAYQTTQVVPPDYTVTAEALMLPPSSSVPAGSNPYLALGGLDAAADVLSKSLSSEAAAAELQAIGSRGEFTVALDPDTPAPLVLVTATASVPQDAAATLALVLDRLPQTLKQIQQAANVPQNAYITSTVITKSTEAVKSSKPQVRSLVIVLGAGIALSLFLAAAIDALIMVRKPRAIRLGAPRRPVKEQVVASRRRPRPARNGTSSSSPDGADPSGDRDEALMDGESVVPPADREPSTQAGQAAATADATRRPRRPQARGLSSVGR